jgi:hypothetical protein
MRIKLVLFVVPIICFIIGISLSQVTSQVNAQLQNGLKKYENSKLGISFQYPSEWKEELELSEPSEDCQKKNNCTVGFRF